MIPLWLDDALEKAVNSDLRLRYDTFSGFFYELTHHQAAFMQHSVPLLVSNTTVLED